MPSFKTRVYNRIYIAAGVVSDRRFTNLVIIIVFPPKRRRRISIFRKSFSRIAYALLYLLLVLQFSSVICFAFCLFYQVKNEGRALFLNAVCMKCLDGKDADRKLCCRFCAVQWDGSSLIMGTMYAYDVFAAMPCCNERLKVCTYTFISYSDQSRNLTFFFFQNYFENEVFENFL